MKARNEVLTTEHALQKTIERTNTHVRLEQAIVKRKVDDMSKSLSHGETLPKSYLGSNSPSLPSGQNPIPNGRPVWKSSSQLVPKDESKLGDKEQFSHEDTAKFVKRQRKKQKKYHRSQISKEDPID